MFICIILFLVVGIVCKSNSDYRERVKYRLYEDNISFGMFSDIYNKYLGGIFPIEGMFNMESSAVFNEELVIKSSIPYKDGAMLDVGYNYLIPSLGDGVVIYIGKKDGYGNVVIVENEDNINIWYGNVCNVNVMLYDYVKKGEIIGEVCDNYLYLLYNKDNEFWDYDDLGIG